MGLFNFLRPNEVIRYTNGDIFTTLFNGKAKNTTLSQADKLKFMLTNPALAKVVYLNCDVFSLAKIKRIDQKQNDPLIKLLNDPNYFQSRRQFLWMYRFWLMFGNAYLKPYSSNIQSDYQLLYLLNPTMIDWKNQRKNLDKLVLSKSSYNQMLNTKITYKYSDGTKQSFELKELKAFHDTANGIDNWFEGSSRIDAIYKILYNSESALDAKSINLEFARKFLVSGNYDVSKNINDLNTMQDVEKEGIIQKLRSNEPVHPIKAEVNIKRFVEDLAKLKLDDSYDSDLMKVGSMYNIPLDVLEALKKGSTYENQEKSMSRHISYSEQPKGDDLLDGLCSLFDLNVDDYEITWNHLPFMQVFEKDRAIVQMTKSRTLETFVKNGADANEAAEYLGIDLKFNSNEKQE